MAEWIPKYIRKSLDYKAKQTLSAKEYNAILNLLVAQGDYNAEWLQYLYTEGIPNAVAQLTTEELQEALTAAVRAEIALLATSVTNKTSAYLNKPLFTFLDVSVQEDAISTFLPLLNSKGVSGVINACTGFVGSTAAYPTLQQLKDAQQAGHEVITSGADVAELTVDNAEASVTIAQEYMINNSLVGGTEVFLYPAGGNNNATVADVVGTYYKYAINLAVENAYVDSDLIDRLNIPVVMVTKNNTIADESVKAAIDNTVATNGWCVLAVDTGSSAYSDEALSGVIDYVQSLVGIDVVTMMPALELVEATINNQLDAIRLSILNLTYEQQLHSIAIKGLKEDVEKHGTNIQACFNSLNSVDGTLTDHNSKLVSHDGKLANALYITSFDASTGTLNTRSAN